VERSQHRRRVRRRRRPRARRVRALLCQSGPGGLRRCGRRLSLILPAQPANCSIIPLSQWKVGRQRQIWYRDLSQWKAGRQRQIWYRDSL